MLTAQDPNGILVEADSASHNIDFVCPMCRQLVILKHGKIRIAHFAHKPPTDCQYGVGETELHRRAKLEIYHALQREPDMLDVVLERPLKTVRPDVSFRRGLARVAIEVQVSTLSPSDIERRTSEYAKARWSVLWLPPYSEKLVNGEK